MNIFWAWTSGCLSVFAVGGTLALVGTKANKPKAVEIGALMAFAALMAGMFALTLALFNLNHTTELKATILERAKTTSALAACESHWIEVAGTPTGRWLLQREHRGTESLAETAKALCTPEVS